MQNKALTTQNFSDTIINSNPQKKLFVLDTNVLMHDPTALFRFKEHDIFLPMVVLEELDQGKKGLSDTARNVRQCSRYLDSLIANKSQNEIISGLEIITPETADKENAQQSGRLFLQSEELEQTLPLSLPGNTPDNSILALALSLQAKYSKTQVILISKDINLRIKASVIGITAEDYTTDKTIDDLDVMPSGIHLLPENFWDLHGKDLKSWQEDGRTFYQIKGDDAKQFTANLCLHTNDETDFEAIVRKADGDSASIEYSRDYRRKKHSVWGITARNREQNFALNFLLDPDIDFLTLVGPAGTGKTLLTLAAALKQTLEDNLYREIIMTRVTIGVGEDIGFLPGNEEEKMTPWMGALMDNLEVLNHSDVDMQSTAAFQEQLEQHRIKIRSLNFMRGRTFLNKFIIIDEAQNLTPKQMQTLVTRAGPGTKVVVLGNISQIDSPYLTETTTGLTYVVQRFKNWSHSAHLALSRGERSRLADYAIDVL